MWMVHRRPPLHSSNSFSHRGQQRRASSITGLSDGAHRGSQLLLQYPLLFVIVCILAFELLCYVLLRIWIASYEKIVTLVRFRRQHQQLKKAHTFGEWAEAARDLDQLEGREQWKMVTKSSFYNSKAIESTVEELRRLRMKNNLREMADLLLQRVFTKSRVSYAIDNEALYSQTHFGTKVLIEELINEVLSCVEVIFEDQHHELSTQEKLNFFDKAIDGYGRSALCLSGGSTIGYYHFGVVLALLEAGILPEVISGTSAGSLVAAMIGCRTDQELREFLVPELHMLLRPFEKGRLHQLTNLMTRGHVFDNAHFYALTKTALFGDMTFREAYEKTGRVLNITVTNKQKHGGQILLNYLTVPDVTLWSAVVASSSIPGLLAPVPLVAKMPSGELIPYKIFGDCWADGSIQNDVPVKHLAESLNVQHFVVSQTNPHIIPFIYYNRGAAGQPSGHLFGSRMRGGFLFSTMESFLKLEMKKWLRLINDLDLMPAYGGSDIRRLFLQTFTGNVTVHLPFGKSLLWAYSRIASDPSFSDMKRYLLDGQRLTWPKLCMIQNQVIFEKTLKEKREQLLSRKDGTFTHS